MDDLKLVNPEIEVEYETEQNEFWDKINEDSKLKSANTHLWPLEERDLDQDDNPDTQLDPNLFYHVETWDWKPKTQEEIEKTDDDLHTNKYHIDNEFLLDFQKNENDYNPDVLSIYRVSITPYDNGSVVKQINAIHTEITGEVDKEIGFDDQNEIVFTKTDISKFDNTQVDTSQIFIVATPYTLYLWIGDKVKSEVSIGAIAIFR